MPSIKYVPIITNEPVQEHHMKVRHIYSGGSMTENRKGYKPCGYIKSYVKDKYALPTYEEISPKISTEIELKNQSD